MCRQIEIKIMNKRYQSKSKNRIAVKVFQFLNAPDYILSVEEYQDMGGYKGILKSHGFSIRDIAQLISGYMSFNDFNSLPAWEG